MRTKHQVDRSNFKQKVMATAISGALSMTAATAVNAQEQIEELVVLGIKGSLTRAMDIKRESTSVVDSIAAEDIGKFPDLNVAESLQRISGVSIDRAAGEGQQVTVRGFGPQFNTVLVNGRQIASYSGGREFNFDIFATELISGADVYKTGRANRQEGGIGATIDIKTAKPLDNPGLQVAGSIKGMYETLSEDTSPSASIIISNTFGDDDNVGLMLAYSHQERQVQNNQILTAGWRPGQTISNINDGVLFTNAFIPRNWDQVVDQQDRTRDNLAVALQFAPSDDVVVTLDGFVSKFEVDSLVTDLASWFEPDRVGSATINPETGTLLNFTQEIGLHQGSGNPATDFVSHTRNQNDVDTDGFGLNVEWDINDQLVASFDASTSSAENNRAGLDRFNVVGIINNYTFDGGGIGGTPTVAHDGFGNGALPDIALNRLHYNEQGNRPSDEDEITEFKADFTYSPGGSTFTEANFGIYRQEREKANFQIFGNQCAFCGYGTAAPIDTLGITSFTASNFFPGLIDTFYTYDGDAYVQFLADSGNPITPTLQNNRYNIEEDITSLYMDFTFESEIGDMPVMLNLGARYAETDIEVGAVQSLISDVVALTDLTLFANRFGPATDFSDGSSYSDLLPSLNVRLDLTEDMVLRFAAYDSLTRPTMNQLSPATTFNEPRRQNLTAQGGNPGLTPFSSENVDLSFEWYYSDDSIASVAFFRKEVQDFIVTLVGEETYTLTDRVGPDFRCTDALCAPGALVDPTDPTRDIVATTEELNGSTEVYQVSRPQNGDEAEVTGFEVAWTHIFDNGFGIQANATFVDSDAQVDADSTQRFALEGLGDSQNLILFYEAERWQARLAYNNRDDFLQLLNNGFNGEPVNTDAYAQWDISASYDVNDNFTVFFEGINITEEERRQTGRFPDQVFAIEDNGARYAVGVRGKF